METRDLFGRQLMCRHLRMNACTEKRLVGIDVANSGNQRLIEQRRFDLTLPRCQRSLQPGGREDWSQRLRAELAVEHIEIVE